MDDSRITIWTNPTTHATGAGTDNGPSLDLRQGYTLQGGSMGQMQLFGISVKIRNTQATGTGQVNTWYWEVSSDNATWYRAGFIGVATHDADDQSTVELKTTLVSQYRYVRLSVDRTGTGTSTSRVNAADFGSLPGTIAAPNG